MKEESKKIIKISVAPLPDIEETEKQAAEQVPAMTPSLGIGLL